MKIPSYLKLRNDIWYLQTYVFGKRVRRSLKLPQNKIREANERALAILSQIKQCNKETLEENPKLESLFKTYLNKIKNEVVIGHYEQVENHLSCFISDLNYKRIKDIIPQEVAIWLNNYPYRNKALKIQTNLNACFSYALKLDIIIKNPIASIPRLKHTYKRKRALTLEQYQEFGKHIMDYSCGNLLLFIMKTGCRFSEAAKLKWNDVSLKTGKAVIRQENNKTRETKTLTLSEDLIANLACLRNKLTHPTGYIFRTSKNKPFSKDNVRRVVKKIGLKIGRPDFTTHALRNTFISLLNEAGASTLTIQHMVGHKKASTTARYFTETEELQKYMLKKLPVF